VLTGTSNWQVPLLQLCPGLASTEPPPEIWIVTVTMGMPASCPPASLPIVPPSLTERPAHVAVAGLAHRWSDAQV
jgi:hypothetical protein